MLDRQAFYDARAPHRLKEAGRFYHRLVRNHCQFLIPPGLRVLEIGSGLGDLLAALKPSFGVGIDFSPQMVALASERHPHLQFQVAEASAIAFAEPFDYIVLSDLVNDLQDVQAVLEALRRVSHPRTRLVLNFFNSLWRPILAMAEGMGAKAPNLPQNWLSVDDMANLLQLAKWELVKTETRVLWPLNTPGWQQLMNRVVGPIFPSFCLAIFQVARPRPDESAERQFSCSVVIPARNEAGNIEAAVLRTPELGLGTEMIFVEGHSKDNTWEEIQRVAAKYPHRKIKILKQKSKGKGGAVREAFDQAEGDILFILDADLTMPPEELPKFYEVMRSGQADFVNGVRLVYPMEQEAMQFLNMIANKIFGLTFSWLLGQTIKDTLCGTKVLFRKDYLEIARNRAYFGEFDPFGDFDLLFGASKLNLRIVDLPIRYKARSYGETNIHRWSHGWLLLRMVVFAAKRLKFIE